MADTNRPGSHRTLQDQQALDPQASDDAGQPVRILQAGDHAAKCYAASPVPGFGTGTASDFSETFLLSFATWELHTPTASLGMGVWAVPAARRRPMLLGEMFELWDQAASTAGPDIRVFADRG